MLPHELLQDGITGFYRGSKSRPPEVSREQITSDCRLVASELRQPVGKISTSPSIRNFYTVEFGFSGETTLVLFNQHYAVCAFSRCFTDGNPVEFIECSQLTDMFQRLTQFHPIPYEALEHPVTPADMTNLNVAERKQVAYWKPKNVGDLIFNYWD